MSWQIIALIGVLLIVSATVGGGVSLVGIGSMPAFTGIGRSIAVALAGVLVLAIAYLTWRDAPIAQQNQGSGLAGLLNPIMHKFDQLATQFDVASSGTDLTLSPASGPLDSPIRATGNGFLPGEKVDLRSGTTVLTTVKADKNGKISSRIRIDDGEWCHDRQCEIIIEGKQSLKWTTAVYNLTAHTNTHSTTHTAAKSGTGKLHRSVGCSITTNPITELRSTRDPVGTGERMPAGTYHVIRVSRTSWVGSQIQWFEITENGRTGWVRDDPAEVDSRSATCP